MAMGNNGGLFIGALKPEDKEFLKPLLENARAHNYNRFVEPCAGAMAMSYLAAECGYPPDCIEASDISYFSGAFARGINGETTEGMRIEAEGFTEEELRDPAVALYAQLYLRTLTKAGRDYFYQLLLDLKYRRDEHIETIRAEIAKTAKRVKGFKYEDKDMFEHIREVKDDENAVVVLCPPTYTAGYEHFFDTDDKLKWAEPSYEIFDVATGLKDLYEEIKDAKALFIVYEECKAGASAGYPVYGRDAGRPGMYMYLTSNRPEEATALARGKEISRKRGAKMSPLKNTPILPRDYEITEKCKIAVQPILPENATYYRLLWTHNFTGGASGSCFGLYIDGYIAGVFGYNSMTMLLGGKNDLVFSFGICAPHKQRLNRILYKVACTESVLAMTLDDVQQFRVEGVQTAIITKYPESKEMRGLMKLVERIDDKPLGYKLRYRCDKTDMSFDEILKDWCRREKKWAENRRKSGKN